MDINAVLGLLESITIWSIFKVMLLIGILVYVSFAFLMMRQVGEMSKAVKMPDDYVVRILAVAHFVAAVLVFLLAMIIL